MMSAFVTDAIGDSISLPVKLLLRTTYNHAGRKTLTLTIRLFSCSSASIDDISLGGFMNRPLPLVALFGPGAMSGLSPQCAPSRSSLVWPRTHSRDNSRD